MLKKGRKDLSAISTNYRRRVNGGDTDLRKMVAEVKHTEAERLRAAIDRKLKQLVRMNRSRMDFMERLQQMIDE